MKGASTGIVDGRAGMTGGIGRFSDGIKLTTKGVSGMTAGIHRKAKPVELADFGTSR